MMWLVTYIMIWCIAVLENECTVDDMMHAFMMQPVFA